MLADDQAGYSVGHEIRPRAYARHILNLEDKEARRAALAEIPEHLRELTRKHVEIVWNHPKGGKA
ncbi:hypothetical protein P3W55_13335 [Pseudomonas citronellolis]|uniref:Uncharacterized protein n=1 Tax=Pseudomonas citronellolis TaxID=53408 RepID=A0AAW6P5E9_9PSED|nr:hypothetical protein [Pseudomonas citronellolis]MDF3842693.1 hypothetical protein [Pseudomonas citronellolis]